MSKPAAFITSVSVHDKHTPSSLITGASTVFIEGKPAARIGDVFAPHILIPDPHTPHTPSISSGSSTVFIEGKPAARIGDSTNCGGTIITGASTVFIG